MFLGQTRLFQQALQQNFRVDTAKQKHAEHPVLQKTSHERFENRTRDQNQPFPEVAVAQSSARATGAPGQAARYSTALYSRAGFDVSAPV